MKGNRKNVRHSLTALTLAAVLGLAVLPAAPVFAGDSVADPGPNLSASYGGDLCLGERWCALCGD